MFYCILRIVNYFHLCNDKCKRQIKNYNLRTAQKTITNCSFFFLSFSLWGKFGERQNKPVTHCITQPADLFRILDDSSLFISAIRICSEDVMEIVTTTAEEEYERSFKTNVFVAAFTTSLARLKLYEALHLQNQTGPGETSAWQVPPAIYRRAGRRQHRRIL